MVRHVSAVLLGGTLFAAGLAAWAGSAWAGQAPAADTAPDIPISHHDRVYAAE